MIDTERVKQFALLVERKKALKSELSDLEKEIRDIKGPMIKQMIAEDCTKIRVEVEGLGPRTVHLASKMTAKIRPGFDRDDVAAALEACGEGELVRPNYNTNTLVSRLKELAGVDGDGLPQELDRVLEMGVFADARSVKAS